MATGQDFFVVSKNDDHVLTIRLQLHVITDMIVTDRIQTQLLNLVENADPCRGVVLDFKEVHVMSSQFIGTLLKLSKLCKKKGHGLALSRMSRSAKEPITIMKLDRLLKRFDDLPSAVGFLTPH